MPFARRFFLAIALCAASSTSVTAKGGAEDEFDAIQAQVNEYYLQFGQSNCKRLRKDIKSDSVWYLGSCYHPVQLKAWDENREKARMLLHRLLGLKADLRCLSVPAFSYHPWYERELDELKADFVVNYISPAELQRQIRTKRLRNDLLSWDDSSWSTFVANLVDRERTRRPQLKLPKVKAEADGCGDGEVEVEIVKKPKTARVFVINEFEFRVCRARGVDPHDFNACPGWLELLARKEKLAGTYQYRATHAGSAPKIGRFTTGFSGEPLVFEVN